MGNAPFRPLSSKLARPVLHLLQTLTNDADSVDRDLRMTCHQVQELSLAPACLDSFSQSGGIRWVAVISEESDGAEHLAWADETYEYLGAVAAGLGDTHASLDNDVSANAFITLVEDPGSRLQPSRACGGGPNLKD
jgi:hypothetical protein